MDFLQGIIESCVHADLFCVYLEVRLKSNIRKCYTRTPDIKFTCYCRWFPRVDCLTISVPPQVVVFCVSFIVIVNWTLLQVHCDTNHQGPHYLNYDLWEIHNALRSLHNPTGSASPETL